MDADQLDDLLATSAPPARLIDARDVRAMMADAGAEARRPKRRRRVAVLGGALAMPLVGAGGVATAGSDWLWNAGLENPDWSYHYTAPTWGECEIRLSAYEGGFPFAAMEANKILGEWFATADVEAAASDLLAYLSRRAGADDGPDLLGETMVVAWRRVRELPDEPEQARMWLFGIARGTLLNHARGARRRWALADRIRTHAPEEQASPGADAGAEVRDAIARLDPDHAELIRLVHWDGFALVEAAQMLGIPASTARGRYARAKEELRAALSIEVPLA